MKAFAGRGIVCGAVFDTAEVLANEHLRERGTIVDLDHPTRGRFSTIISPLRLSESPVEPRRAPLYGEHTEAVLRDLAGYSDDEIAALAREEGDYAGVTAGMPHAIPSPRLRRRERVRRIDSDADRGMTAGQTAFPGRNPCPTG